MSGIGTRRQNKTNSKTATERAITQTTWEAKVVRVKELTIRILESPHHCPKPCQGRERQR